MSDPARACRPGARDVARVSSGRLVSKPSWLLNTFVLPLAVVTQNNVPLAPRTLVPGTPEKWQFLQSSYFTALGLLSLLSSVKAQPKHILFHFFIPPLVSSIESWDIEVGALFVCWCLNTFRYPLWFYVCLWIYFRSDKVKRSESISYKVVQEGLFLAINLYWHMHRAGAQFTMYVQKPKLVFPLHRSPPWGLKESIWLAEHCGQAHIFK